MLHKLLKRLKPNNKLSDPFIKRLRSLVIGEGMLKPGNIRSMDIAIQQMPENGSVIEIGSYGGLSANLLIHLMSKYARSNPFYTCDAWIYEGYTDHLKDVPETHIDGRPDVPRSAYATYMMQAFIQSTTLLSSHRLPYSFHMRSEDFFNAWNAGKTETDVFGRTRQLGGDIAFAYIDGGHSYAVARSDFNHVASHLLVGGFILLDDSADDDQFGSATMMSEIKKDNRFKVVAKNPNYLIQKIG
jgi:hypothetical protein